MPSPTPPIKRRILVVDDNTDGADSLVMLLEMMGHQCTVAYDGPEALRVAEDFRPEVIFLDIGLPTLSGFEVAQQLRQRDWTKNLALVALTGRSQPEDRKRSSDAGFDHHMVKPVEFDALDQLMQGPL